MKLQRSADRERVRIARLIALASIIMTSIYAQADAGLWRFVPPNVHAVIGLDWKRAGQSELGQWLREQWLGSEAAAVTGPEFLDSVDHILMSSAGAREAKREPPLLIAIQGRFDLTKLRKSLLARGAKVQVFESMAIYRPPGKDARDLAFAPLDAHIVLAGDARSVYEAIEKSRTAADDDRSELLARARRMDAAYDCWALLQAPGALASEHFTLGVFGAEEFSADARAIEAGITFRGGMVLRAAVTARSESAAKETSVDFERLIKLAARDRNAQPALALFASKLKIGLDRATVLISANMSEPETVKLARRLAAPKGNAAIIEMPPEESKKPVIRIEGLDDGPREVPYRP